MSARRSFVSAGRPGAFHPGPFIVSRSLAVLAATLLAQGAAHELSAQVVRPPVAAEPGQPVPAPAPAPTPPMLSPAAALPALLAQPAPSLPARPAAAVRTTAELEALRPEVEVVAERPLLSGVSHRGNRRRPIIVAAESEVATMVRVRFPARLRGIPVEIGAYRGLELAPVGPNSVFGREVKAPIPVNGEILVFVRLLDAEKGGDLVIQTGSIRSVVPVVGVQARRLRPPTADSPAPAPGSPLSGN